VDDVTSTLFWKLAAAGWIVSSLLALAYANKKYNFNKKIGNLAALIFYAGIFLILYLADRQP
jgi:hypothetical protein